MAGVTYSLVFQNNSSNTWDAAVYQNDPDIGNPNVQSLAWFSKTTAPTTKTTFSWEVDYSFVWSETGQLVPGVQFAASQTWAANLTSTNQVGFSNSGGAFTFRDQEAGPQAGTLYVRQDGSIPAETASVGIGMSGSGVYVVQAQPNITATFTPHPVYYITFGTYSQGEVLDIGQITNAAAIQFPVNVYSMTAILNADNTWTVKPTSQVNASFAKARQSNREALWGQV